MPEKDGIKHTGNIRGTNENNCIRVLFAHKPSHGSHTRIMYIDIQSKKKGGKKE